MKGTCRKGHDLNVAENAVTGTRTNGTSYRYCKVCSTARARDKAVAAKAAKTTAVAGESPRPDETPVVPATEAAVQQPDGSDAPIA